MTAIRLNLYSLKTIWDHNWKLRPWFCEESNEVFPFFSEIKKPILLERLVIKPKILYIRQNAVLWRKLTCFRVLLNQTSQGRSNRIARAMPTHAWLKSASNADSFFVFSPEITSWRRKETFEILRDDKGTLNISCYHGFRGQWTSSVYDGCPHAWRLASLHLCVQLNLKIYVHYGPFNGFFIIFHHRVIYLMSQGSSI